jgi:hypothetical protein
LVLLGLVFLMFGLGLIISLTCSRPAGLLAHG